ncbi:thiopeptide maturation pyridine synthase [Streptomyces sp. RFCAC02]|uniref:thiopeptide maturation pyridine synthase n=1 Tax=Streptomyces sp. RFCAC02 TaxID=2499143 RepID=UPI0010216B09|nr:thiopeptide maturation pyridine synthase [Streptomyces sp. RFCAC02]
MNPTTPARWHSLHVAYYAPDKDALLLDAVRPALAHVADRVSGAHVLRHWRRGPHLRINVRTEPARWRESVRPDLTATIGAHLRAHPSTTVLDPDEALPRHRLLALREQEKGPLTPWYPDNSLHEEPYADRRHVMGADAAADALTAFYDDATGPLFAMLEHIRQGRGTRQGLAVTLLLATAHAGAPPLTRSFLSFRSHADGFLSGCGDPAAVRARFEAAFARRRGELVELVRAVTGALDDPAAPAPPFVREWAALLADHGRRAEPLIARGELARPDAPRALPVPELPGVPAGVRVRGLPRDLAYSDLHRTVFGSEAYQREVFTRPDFLRYRVLLNHTYLHLTRLGLTPVDRFLTCHLAARAVEETYGVSAVDLMRRAVDRIEARPD